MTTDRTPLKHGVTPMTGQLPLDLSAFHQMHRPRYIAYAETFLHNRDDAEEVADDTFLQLWTKWEQVLASENPAAYAWGILRNKIADHAKARKRRPSLDEAAFDTAALRQAVDPIGQVTESLAVFRAMRMLTDRQLDVMVMVYLHGLTPGEVGDALGISPPTVRSTARHARRRLREILGPDRTMEGHTDGFTH
ncbi:sigma-70 family RNA polymerase sigma factor (plasmid) [Streptomyces scopuliridis]|uniref:RNA polymerase sigma factor n=1 Tax=Streptomyces scopuliridis TaxID=452529 RepID=UPI002DDB56DA|nr:sigma-70 family RNA polymerase sigma factor [Streptomyces scopuliridis]WSB39198.1 sigma-70 family RNA polymerase sigma factor [Streptomyces scopuliridis]